jgi:hypothetical protein
LLDTDNSLIGGNALLQLCSQRLDAIHRRSTRRRSSVRGSRHQLDLHIAAEHIGIAAESGQCGYVLAGSLEPTDGAARGAHPYGDLLLGETGALACLQKLPEQTEFHSSLLPRPSHPVPAQTPQRQDAPMPPPASTIYERLRAFIAERMHMSPIDQPLML